MRTSHLLVDTHSSSGHVFKNSVTLIYWFSDSLLAFFANLRVKINLTLVELIGSRTLDTTTTQFVIPCVIGIATQTLGLLEH